MQWRKKQRVLYVIGSANHALLIKQYRDDADCLYSTNEDDGEADHATTSPIATNGPGSYARAAQPGRGKPGSKPRPSGYQPAYYRPHRSMPESRQPLVTAEKKTFNEEEYTKITTPRQDVLFKKGYLGRKKTVTSTTTPTSASDPAAAAAAAATAAAVTGATLTATNCIELAPMHNGGDCEPQPGEQTEVLSPSDEQPQYIYPNGYVDGVIYVNGGYEWYDPYGNVTVVVGPAPPFAGPGGGASVLAAVPCQPLPLQPIEWFNPAYGVPYVTPALPQCPRERDRRKRCSADSQNCSPQSSESTDPPGSPQEGEGEGEGEGECEGDGEGEGEDVMLPALPGLMNGADEYAVYPHGHPVQPHPAQQPQAYMYPGAYMFGQPIYSMNGITVQSTAQLPQNTDNSGSKRRKKKRRRRRRRGGVDDGSEETSSDEKDLEEPASLTSQESSQEVESDSKNSAGSASCPTVVGCPELPERTPESPSSSPSLSPSLSPSPSPSNATEDKTALPKVKFGNTNTQQEKTNVRSEGNTENRDTLQSKSSLQGADLPCIPNIKNSDVYKLNETNLQTPTIIQNGESIDDPVLLIDASKTNGNYPVDDGKSFELDNNQPITNSFSVSTCGESDVVNSAGFTNESVTKNNISVSKQKSKGKKGIKNNKQKAQLPVQNGFPEVQINDHSSKSRGTPIEMDGNENGSPGEGKHPPNASQQMTSKQADDSKSESETSSESTLHLDNNTTKNKVDLYSQALHSPEAPKKPVRTHHQNRQQQKSQLPQLPQSTLPQQQRKEERLNLSSISQTGNETTEETNLTNPTTVPHSDLKTNINVTVSVVPISESKPEKGLENTEINLNKSDITESDSFLTTEQTAVCEESNTQAEKDNDTAVTQESKELPKKVIPDSPQDEKKILSKMPCTSDMSASETQKGFENCDTNENNKSDAQMSLSTVPEWATSTPPIPPPRRKKWQPKSSVERPPTPGRELEVKKQGEIIDDSSSSSSRESEESVIDLLSSSPNDKSNDTKEYLHEIGYAKSYSNVTTKIFSGFDASPHTELNEELVQNTKSSKGDEARERAKINKQASKLDKSTCISKKSQQISKGDQSQNKQSELKGGLLAEEKMSNVGTHNVHGETTGNAAKTYADDLVCQVLDEGLSSAATSINKTYQTQSLSLTEAVTQWLHSQDSEDVLQVPQLLDSESEIDDLEASEEEIQMTGPKNVYRNPLLAPSCEAKSIYDDAGIRVANLKKNNTLIDQEETDTQEMKMLPDLESMENSIHRKENFMNGLEKQYMIELQEQRDENSLDKISSSASSSICTVMKKEENNMKLENSGMKDGRQKTQGLSSEEWESFTTESAEYDADWECDPVTLKHPSQVFRRDDQDSNLSLESADDKCSFMCDPTLSVAKYYRLGPPPEKEISKKDTASDFDSGREDDDDDEGMDALIHFRNELEQHSEEGQSSFLQRLTVGSNPHLTKNKVEGEVNTIKMNAEIYDSSYDGFTSDSGIHSEESCNEDGYRASNSSKSISEVNMMLKRKSAILLSHLGAEGPFPCGGICCILQ